MYSFRDVNENITLVPMPAEAMQINGVYLETEIEGYRTLYVKGREAFSPELETYEIGTRNGENKKEQEIPGENNNRRVSAIAKGFRIIQGSI